MGTDIGLILQRLLAFYDFSGKSVFAVGAGGGQLAEYARSMRKVLAIDRDLAAMRQLQEAAARLNLQDRFEYWTGDFADCDRRADVVLFEFCLHEMDDPSAALHKATALALHVVVIDHAPDSLWAFFTAEDDIVARSWLALGRMQVERQCSYASEQRFADYDELHARVKSQGDESIRRIERFRQQTNIIIPMTYALALIGGTAESKPGTLTSFDRKNFHPAKTGQCPRFQGLTRRRFLGAASAAAAASAVGQLPRGFARPSNAGKQPKTILSFYCDDTGPGTAGAKAFATFLDYCADQGIKGESSLILGASGRSMTREPNGEEAAYLEQVRRAWMCGIDSHMELMTHRGLFDFAAVRESEGVIHEGLWLHEPSVTEEEYERYFTGIIEEGKRADLMFTGLTWPGCSCDACTRRYAELRASGQGKPNPAFWSALLNLARQGKFRSRTVPCFFDASESDFGIHQKASDGECAIYDLMPNAMDRFGIWENNPARVDPDYYITDDGKSGTIVRRVESGAPYCIWYSHWQGLNPGNGVGWRAFTTVVQRIRRHLQERVVWMRPSDITNRYHEAGGWEFLDRL